MGTVGIPNGAYDIACIGDQLYVVNGDHRLFHVDASDPWIPWIVEDAVLPHDCSSMMRDGSLAYLGGADNWNIYNDHGILIVDLTSLRPIGNIGYDGRVTCLSDDGLFVTDGLSGLYRLPRQCGSGQPGLTTSVAESPTAGRILGAYPNPFNPATTVSYECRADERVRLSVLDLAGRRIATLIDGTQAPGRHTRLWNGRDADGQSVAAGTYFLRLETDAGVDVRKVMLIR